MVWGIRLIRDLIPRTAYERESLLKSFLLFFLTMELFLGVIAYLKYRGEVLDFKNSLFLEMKNFSYTFEGEKFSIDVVPLKGEEKFYELIEDEQGAGILVPVPGTQKDALKIYYPMERFKEDLRGILLKNLLFFSISSLFALLLSVLFSLYSLAPLRKALQIIEEVTRDIVHDINTPLMTLRVNLKLLEKKHGGEEVEIAQLALKQLEDLKENLRPLAKKRELSLEELNLKKLVEAELFSLSRMYPDIRTEAELLDVVVKGDREAVSRILGNVLSNAFKHNAGNWVRVKLDRRSLTIENPSREIKNPGMLFERYYRESSRGMGLGLSIVRRLCEEMGWRVRAEYSEGIFRIEITFG